MVLPRKDAPVAVVHEGRGGYVEVDGHRYPIEHVEGGRFCIHVPARAPLSAREAVEALCRHQPEKWSIAKRGA